MGLFDTLLMASPAGEAAAGASMGLLILGVILFLIGMIVISAGKYLPGLTVLVCGIGMIYMSKVSASVI